MIKLTRSQLRYLIMESSKYEEVYFDIEKNPQQYRNEVITQLAANGLISTKHAKKLLDIDMEDRENWEQVASLAMTLADKESLGGEFVDQAMLDNIDTGVKDELIASVVEFAQRYDAGGEASLKNMQQVFEDGQITEAEFENVKKIMRVVPGDKQWYTAPTLSPDRIDSSYSYGTRPNSDIASYLLKLKAYYHNARKASSYDDMKHEGYTDAHPSQIGGYATQIKELCDEVVSQGMAIKLYLNQMDLYIFDPMWVQSNTMPGIGAKDRRKVMFAMDELISQQRKKKDPSSQVEY